MNPSVFNIKLAPLFRIALVYSAIVYNNARDRGGVARSAILHSTASPWRRLLNYGDEKSFITLTGFTLTGQI